MFGVYAGMPVHRNTPWLISRFGRRRGMEDIRYGRRGEGTRGGGKLSAGTGVPGPEEGVIELVNLANAGNLSPGYLPHPKITIAVTCPRT